MDKKESIPGEVNNMIDALQEQVDTASKNQLQETLKTNVAQLEQLKELKEHFDLGEAEDLHPDLEKHIDPEGPLGAFLQHPLVFFAAYDPIFNAHVNKLYLQKKKQANKARKDKNWNRFIWLHERPYRLDAYMDICKNMKPAEYWTILRDIWIDAEFPGVNQKVWLHLFMRKHPDRRKLMTGKERRVLGTLPKEEMDIYRGYYGDEHQEGMSWTTSYDKASWFAKRFAGDDKNREPLVAEAVCNKKDVIAYFNGRKENEILIDPKDITIRRSQAV